MEIHNIFKIVLLGEYGVGKTNIVKRLTTSNYNESHITTLGIDFNVKIISTMGRNVKLQIWDTAGQEKFHSIVTSFFKGAKGIFIVCDMTRLDTFKKIDNWINEIRMYNEHCKIVVIGNKSDDINKNIENRFHIEQIVKEYNLPYIEASAKENINVDHMFKFMINEIINDPNLHEYKYVPNKNNIVLKENNMESAKCCTIL